MVDAVFKRGAAGPPGVSPIVLGNELLQVAFPSGGRLTPKASVQLAPTRLLPAVFDGLSCGPAIQGVRHRPSHIIFAIEPARHFCDRNARDDFRDENDSPAHFAIHETPDVKTQIHFVKFRAQWIWEYRTVLR